MIEAPTSVHDNTPEVHTQAPYQLHSTLRMNGPTYDVRAYDTDGNPFIIKLLEEHIEVSLLASDYLTLTPKDVADIFCLYCEAEAKRSEWNSSPVAAELCELNFHDMTLSDLIRFKFRHRDEMDIRRPA